MAQGSQDGWGTPGTIKQGINLRRETLDSVSKVDKGARLLVPSLPPLRPHKTMLQHLHALLPLIPIDGRGTTPLHVYSEYVERARYSDRELTEADYEMAMSSQNYLIKLFDHYRLGEGARLSPTTESPQRAFSS